MEPQKFTRKPFDVEALRVTDSNIKEVAEWCGGELLSEGGKAFISVDASKPANERQTKAFVGDWVLFFNKGYKVYLHKAFIGAFEPKGGEGTHERAAKRLLKNPVLTEADLIRIKERTINRDAETGQFTTDEAVKENPETTVTETVEVPVES